MQTMLIKWTTLIAFTLMLTPISEALADQPDAARLESVRAELIDLARRDREAREAMVGAWELDGEGGFKIDKDIWEQVEAIDAESLAHLKSLVKEMGWPTIAMVGEDGSAAAWLLVQHAMDDLGFMAGVLELMEPMLVTEQVSPKHYALLKDRVLLAQGEPQIYGTQFQDDGTGVLRPQATEDWEGVETRRLAMGLPPLAEYAESISETYGQQYDLTPLPLEESRWPQSQTSEADDKQEEG